MMQYKPNWTDSRERFLKWWRHEGLLISYGLPAGEPLENVACPPEVNYPDMTAEYCDVEHRAAYHHFAAAQNRYEADALPIPYFHWGPGSFALVLGATPEFAPETVWFHPCWDRVETPEHLPPLRFDPDQPWFKLQAEGLRALARRGRGRFLIGLPDLVEGLDTLATLRGTEALLEDLVVRPEWVEEKLAEIDAIWFEVYQRLYEIAKEPDGSSAYCVFGLWGPGRCAKLQCDISAMISPAMFNRFVVPHLRRQCEWLDSALYHLDGPDALCHLDALLGIDALDAIEWTPGPADPPGDDPHWWPMYRRILAAGKSVQILGTTFDRVEPMLDAIGHKGVYACCSVSDENDRVRAQRLLEQQLT